MTSNPDNLDDPATYSGNERVMVGNGQSLPISHIGSVSTVAPNSSIPLSNVLVVPGIKKNLISISQLTKQINCRVIFDSLRLIIQDRVTGTVLGVGRCENGLYVLNQHHHALVSLLSAHKPRASAQLWHTRLGHPNYRIISSLSRLGSILCSNRSLPNNSNICVGCQLGKSHCLPFSLNDEHCSMPFDRLHCDLWGPSPVSSVTGYRYYAIFIDDCTRFSWMFPLKHKSDFFDTFVHLQHYIETQFSTKIKSFQCDGGTEFTNNKFRSHLHSCGIVLRLACPYTPSQNGVAERKHRHVTETGLTLMFHAHVPVSLWVEAFSTAIFLINRLPSPSLDGKTPYEILFGKSPDYSMLRTFRCLCFSYLKDYSPHKLSPKSAPCVFLGYSTLHKGFRCLDRKTHRVYVSRHVQFYEHHFPYTDASFSTLQSNTDYTCFSDCADCVPSSSHDVSCDSLSSSSVLKSPCLLYSDFPGSLSYSSLQVPISAASLPATTPLNSRVPSPMPSPSHVPANRHHMISRGKAGIFKPRLHHALTILSSNQFFQALLVTKEPKGFKFAAKNPKWLSTMDDEILALKRNGTWTLVPRPQSHNVVGCRWIFKVKPCSDGSTERHKARLVAQGFSQVPSLDFGDTFSPVVRPATV